MKLNNDNYNIFQKNVQVELTFFFNGDTFKFNRIIIQMHINLFFMPKFSTYFSKEIQIIHVRILLTMAKWNSNSFFLFFLNGQLMNSFLSPVKNNRHK